MATWGGPRVTRLRAKWIEQLPLQCWRCGHWIMSAADLSVGHIIEVDRAPELMWDEENLRPEHARRTAHCVGNYSAGATYGNRKRGARQPAPVSRQWVR